MAAGKAPAEAKPGGTMPGGAMPGGAMPCGMMSGGMPCGMMGSGAAGSTMPSMMEAMMPGKARGCMMMAEGMMKGGMDMAHMQKALALSDEQSASLRAGVRPFQKEAILGLAALEVAELELADLLAAEKVDFGKVEAKLKESEALRTKVRLAHLKAAEAVKGTLTKEQLEQLGKTVEGGAVPAAGEGHEQHH